MSPIHCCADSKGTADITVDLRDGTYFVLINERGSRDDGSGGASDEVLLGSSLFVASIVGEDHFAVLRLLHKRLNLQESTYGGVVLHGTCRRFRLVSCHPGASLTVNVLNMENVAALDDVWTLMDKNERMEQRLRMLEGMMQEVYFAPEMPGYLDAQRRFAERSEVEHQRTGDAATVGTLLEEPD